jgi:hypothetical protein
MVQKLGRMDTNDMRVKSDMEEVKPNVTVPAAK